MAKMGRNEPAKDSLLLPHVLASHVTSVPGKGSAEAKSHGKRHRQTRVEHSFHHKQVSGGTRLQGMALRFGKSINGTMQPMLSKAGRGGSLLVSPCSNLGRSPGLAWTALACNKQVELSGELPPLRSLPYSSQSLGMGWNERISPRICLARARRRVVERR